MDLVKLNQYSENVNCGMPSPLKSGNRYFSPLQAESGLVTKSHSINILLILSTSPYR